MKTNTQHTPGPWYLNEEPHSVDFTVWADGGRFPVVTEVNDNLPFAENVANLRLISAAPDLLDALEWIHAVCQAKAAAKNATVDLHDLRDFASIAAEAIAKAKGGEQ